MEDYEKAAMKADILLIDWIKIGGIELKTSELFKKQHKR